MNLKIEDLQNIETLKNLAKSNNLNFISAKCPDCKYQLLSVKVDVITLYDKLLIENLLSSGWSISLEDKMIDVSTRNKNDCCPDLGIAKLFKKNLEETSIILSSREILHPEDKRFSINSLSYKVMTSTFTDNN
jgi:hypothetical protein